MPCKLKYSENEKTPERQKQTGVLNSTLYDIKNYKNISISLGYKCVEFYHSDMMYALSVLAGGVAHEMNSPLCGVLTNLGLMSSLGKASRKEYAMIMKICIESIEDKNKIAEIKRKFKKLLRAEKKRSHLLATAEKGGSRCRLIIEEMLRFSVNSRSGPQVHFDLNKCIEELLTLLGALFSYENIIIHRNLLLSLPDFYGNRGEIAHCLLNLLINAVQAVEGKGGEIEVSTNILNKEVIVIKISDTGNGINDELRNKIFVPFFTTKGVGKGKGLGLSVAYSIIEKYGGIINYKSVAGKGTTFIIHLPLVAEG